MPQSSSSPSRGDSGEGSPSRAPKKHSSFHIWRSKKKQPPPPPSPSECGVFVPHPPLDEARTLEVADGDHIVQESQEVSLHCGESQFFHLTNEASGPVSLESGVLKKSRAQPPEENKRKPVLGKLGNLFTAGRRRNTRNGFECPSSSNPKNVTPAKLSQREGEKSTAPGGPPPHPDACPEGPTPESEGQGSEGSVRAGPLDSEVTPGSGSRAVEAAAVQQGHESASPQLEPPEAQGATFPGATTAAKQPHSSPEDSPGREHAVTPAPGLGEDPALGAGCGEQEAVRDSIYKLPMSSQLTGFENVSLSPAKPKHVELNLKHPKNLDSLGNEHNPFSQPVHKGNTATKISLFENKRANSSPRQADSRGTRNIPPSNKTFVGRAKLNLAKKAKEMEQPEKKVMPNSHHNDVLVKESPVEPKATVPEEETGTRRPSVRGNEGDPAKDQTLSSQLNPREKAEVHTDAACPSVVTALAPVRNHTLLGEDNSKAADSKRLDPENMTDPSPNIAVHLNTKDSPPPAVPKAEDTVCDSQPPAESSNGPSFLSTSAPSPMDVPEDKCTQVPVSSFPCTDAHVPGNHNGVFPASHQDHENTPLSEPGGEGEVTPPLSAEAVGDECPSKVLVQVRSFMLPMENTQDVNSQIISDHSETQEVHLSTLHNDEIEVVSVASCAPQKEEVLGSKSTSPKPPHGKEEHTSKLSPEAVPLASEDTPPSQAPTQTSQPAPTAEPSPTNSPYGGKRLEVLQRPDHPVVNGQDSPAGRMSISAGSDDSVLDSSSDMEKFTEIIKKMDSSVCVPQKKKKARVPNSPTPPFAMPPIHEDNLEKVFDPSVFTVGLGKKRESQPEMSPALQLMQNLDAKSRLRPKRAGTEHSVLFKSLQANPDGKNEPVLPPETNDKENRDITNVGVKRSRLEKSALFSGMLAPALPQDQIFSPSVTSVKTMTTSFSTSPNSSLSRSSGLQPRTEAAPPCGADTEQPHLPNHSLKVFNFDSSATSHSGFKSPSYMDKYLHKEEAKKDVDSRSNLHLPEVKFSELSKLKTNEDPENTSHLESAFKPSLPNFGNSDTDFVGLFKSSRYDPNIAFSGLSLSDTMSLRGSAQNKINPRPGKLVIYSEPEASDACVEVFRDVQDCSSWTLSPVIVIKVVRGCWILYEKPNFEGHSIPLEEGELELSALWGTEDTLENNDEAESAKPMVIGSIRHVIQDYRVSQIDLFTEPEGLGLQNSYFDDTEEIQGFGLMHKTRSIKVHWGTWLIYEDPGFQGSPFILEPGEYPDLSFWGTEEAYIGSMRPLKMGGRKVEFPTDPKVVVYEKPSFEGRCLELETEMYSFLTEGGEAGGMTGDDGLPLTSVGSMKVLRGIWVAYEKPGFAGHQYLLEEGEYQDWKEWGGYNGELQSLRPILGDFSNAHMIMYSDKNFGSKGSSIDVLGIVANLKETGYGAKTQSINVLSGVWVAYENPDFTGEQYVLDKGLYTSFEDWGGKNCKISSLQPICLDSFAGPRRRNQIHLFSEAQFQGCSQQFEETTNQIDDSFSAKSCRVLGGSWVAYDGEHFSGNQYVLEEGHYPCLSAMGCPPGATFKSLRFIDAEFSEPTIILFEREDFNGKKIELNAETVNLRCLGFNTLIRSVQVIGGIWVTYEYGNYRGRQFLLSPAEIPNWYEFSGCRQIGSLRPFAQKRIYFRLRNKATGLLMSTNGNLEDLKLLRIQVMEDVGADDQIWIYQEGCIKCRIAEDCCLTIVGSLVTSGSKLGLALDQNADSQFWSMKSDGRIYSKLKPHLVLDIKGGAQYDQNHIILNTVSQEKLTQVWEAMVL
ncbi:beta/gamma crystallin domain-containing protein 1 [Echinops telfairi]|uniref:Beta/gamma crystallin domain-containing protein 1 n=1 Tax=Echinops telfairi TaxID=9371 RepID=A0ABM1VL13_ECHTE|nr:beta/gamma crystallin domain-containing protein 1 [Echinops telfairi]